MEADSEQDAKGLKARDLWIEGCDLLSTGDGDGALLKFQAASEMNPAAKMYGLSIALALSAMRQWSRVQQQMTRIAAQWADDVRFGLAWAMIAIARGDTTELKRAKQTSGEADAKHEEDYYFALLWRRQFPAALDLAIRMSETDSTWLEKAGDVYMFLKDPAAALKWYDQSIEAHPDSVSVLLKLSDVYFLLGDLQKERSYRESIYGALR